MIINSIRLPEGGNFSCSALIAHMKLKNLTYIIQGQQNFAFQDHTKPQSLDYWLRVNFAKNKDTKQAANCVIADLLATGFFSLNSSLICPDSGRRAKGLKLLVRD